ncbi:MAG TPA: hypothetical protein VLD37_00270 [Candidatus Bilamarchaeum sp.]|nr:hypothetical protein [Candidatus Bilamarchaeum sp.]
MIESIRKSFNAFSKMPFMFVWASLMYLFMLGAVLFAAIGFGLAYIVLLSVLSIPVDLYSATSMAVFGVIALAFIFVSGGLNASLARAYHSAYWKEKTSMTAFFRYALNKAPEMFGIMLVRDLVWLVLGGPAIAIFLYFLSDVEFMDALLIIYLLFVTFVVHMLFTPALLSAGAFGTDLISSFRHGLVFMRKRHIYFIGIFAVFSLAWVLNWIPLLDLATIFFFYPVMYAAMVLMMEDSIKIERSDE